MKLFKKKEEKNKVGRPKLADMDTKKKSIIMCAISSLLVIMLLAGGLVSLNILPNFNRLKGSVNTALCSEIPARFRPRSETNPEGLHEYGFTDPKFYSAVVSSYNNDSTYCSAITEAQLGGISSFSTNYSSLTNADGVQYLTGLKTLHLSSNNLSSIDLSGNTALTSLDLSYNNLSSIDLSHNTALKYLYLSDNKLSSIDLSGNTALTSLDLWDNSFDKTYSSTESSITLDSPNIITSYPNDTTYSIGNTSIATYENGVVKRVAPGRTTLNIKYKISESCEYTVNHTIDFIGITSSLYKIDDENKTIDLNNGILEKVVTWEFTIAPYGYNLNINGDKLEIKDNNGTVVDTYQMINMRSKVSDAYKKAGFKDKNFYSCVVNKEYEDYLITEEELKRNDWLYCSNKEIEDVTGIEKLTNLRELGLSGNNLSSIDLSKLENLENLFLENNKLEEVILPNSSNLQLVSLINNNLKSIDLSNFPNLSVILLHNNPLTNTIYIIKDGIVDYNNVKLNENIKVNYSIDDSGIASYEDGKLKGLKEGTTLFKMSNGNIISYLPEYIDKCSEENLSNNREYCDSVSEEDVISPYFMSNEIKVYDIKSDVYKIYKDKKTIDVKGTNLDVSKVKLTLDGLKGIIEGNYYVIKDGNREVDKYKILNLKVDKEEITTTTITTTKKEVSNKSTIKTTTKSNTTTTKENKDIELSTNIVPSILLQSIKGQDRNIVVTKDNITFTINGKDIENINGNIDLSVEIEDIEKTILKEELKEKVEKAVVLNFKNESELPGKVLVEVKETEEIKKTIGTKDINVYNYNKDKYNLVAENLSLNNNKITFYVDKLGYYVLTNEKVEDKYVEVDDSMMGENTKLNKEIKQKKIIIPIVIIIIIITLGIVGYVVYKKGKDK